MISIKQADRDGKNGRHYVNEKDKIRVNNNNILFV